MLLHDHFLFFCKNKKGNREKKDNKYSEGRKNMQKNLIVKQHDLRDCGVCCLASIIKYYKGNIPLEKLKLDTKTGKNGTSALHLIKAARKYGFESLGQKIANENYEKIVLPAIAHVVLKNGLNHFVVLYKVNKKDVLLMDPAKGFVKMKKEEFQKIWTNIIVVLKPINKLPVIVVHNTLKQLFIKIVKNEKNTFAKLLGFSLLITLLSIATSYFLKFTTNSIENHPMNITFLIIGSFLFLNILKVYVNYIKNEFIIYLNKNIDLQVTLDFIRHIFNLPLYVVKNKSSGEILKRAQELSSIKELFTEIVINLILNLVLIVSSAFFLFQINNQLFFILCIMVILYFMIGVFYTPMINKKLDDIIDSETEYNSVLMENIESIESLKNLNITKKAEEKVEKSFVSYCRENLSYMRFFNLYNTIKSSIYEIGLFLTTAFGVVLIAENKLSLISLITFNTLLTYFLSPVEEILNLIPKYELIKVSFNKINEFLNIEKETLGKKEKFYPGDIKFEQITYSYDNYKNIVENKTFLIKEKEHILISGDSGCGKSTLCKMLCRNIDDYIGNITIHNMNIKDYSLNTIKENIIYVSQRETLFTDSIKNNITLNKVVSMKELNQIIKVTELDKILDKKALRLDSLLLDSGFNLSGGERQRIVLARALLKKPKILILDESLSELDETSEKHILTNLKVFLQNTTLIYVSHNHTNYLKNKIEMDSV